MRSFVTSILLGLTLIAGVAHADTRDVDPTLLAIFNKERQLAFSNATVVDSGAGTDCINWNRYGGLAAQGCTAQYNSAWYVADDTVVTRVVVEVNSAADGGSTCQLDLQTAYPDSVAVSEMPSILYDQTTIGTTSVSATTPFILEEGTTMQFTITNGAGGCNQTNDAWVTVHIYGYPLYSVN